MTNANKYLDTNSLKNRSLQNKPLQKMSRSKSFVKPFLLAAPVIGLIMSLPTHARSSDDKGIYFGGNYSQVKTKDADEFNDDNDAYGLHIGAQLNPFISIEGGYLDFGSYGSDASRADTDGYTLAFKAGLPLTDRFDIYAQAGHLWWETDYQVLGFNGSIDGDEPFYGVGAAFGLTENLHLRLEYNRYQVEFDQNENGPITGSDRDADLDQASVGLSMYF
jgi:opacity protein-like surface antigen